MSEGKRYVSEKKRMSVVATATLLHTEGLSEILNRTYSAKINIIT